MRVMVIVKATKTSEAGALPSEQLMAEMTRFNEELARAGILLAGEGLKPSSEGRRVRFNGSKRTVTSGPFTGTTHLVAGFWLWQVKSLEEAVEWAKRCPDPMPGERAEIEIRPIMEADELAASDPTGELRRREEHLRESLEHLPH